jgi:uncharacterized membrane protein/protein-disulfide isomerase
MQFLVIALRLVVLFALGTSAALLADQVSGAGAFCRAGGDCEDLAASEYGRPLGVPLSAVGVGGFAVLFVLTLLPGRRAWWAVRALALAAGAAGVALLVIQFAVLHRVCPLCVAVDVSGVVTAALALLAVPVPPSRVGLLVWIVAGALAVVVPVCWSALQQPEPIPEEFKKYWVPGRVTVIEMTDFECPYCRKADAVLQEARARHDFHFVRLVVPLDRHEHAKPAARAYLAAVRQGKGEQMAAALYAAESRAADRCRLLAGELGLNLAEYDKAVEDPAIDAELYKNAAWSRKLGDTIPLTMVQDQLIRGVPKPEALDEAIRNARPPER